MGKMYKNGNAVVQFTEDMEGIFLSFLQTVTPNAEKIMREELDKIEEEAVKDWPKRKPAIRTNKEGEIVYFRDRSKKSYRMFRRGVRVTAGGVLEVYLKNTADYSYLMFFGADSRNKDGKDIIQPQGKLVADELLVKPLKKSARKVVRALMKDLSKRV
jgi:hypothetical protein